MLHHITKHEKEGSGGDQYSCEQCGMRFKKKERLEHHVMKQHQVRHILG